MKHEYQVVYQEVEDGWIMATVPELPGAVTQGHLVSHGCHLDREGGNHSIYRNPANGRCAAVPRHREIKETVARAICDQLGIPRP